MTIRHEKDRCWSGGALDGPTGRDPGLIEAGAGDGGEGVTVVMEAEKRDLKKEIERERGKKRTDPMWFFDDADEQWRTFRKEAQPLEREHLELRVALRDAEAALRGSPADERLNARVSYLKRRLADLEKLAPWIASDTPMEILLWGVPHG